MDVNCNSISWYQNFKILLHMVFENITFIFLALTPQTVEGLVMLRCVIALRY